LRIANHSGNDNTYFTLRNNQKLYPFFQKIRSGLTKKIHPECGNQHESALIGARLGALWSIIWQDGMRIILARRNENYIVGAIPSDRVHSVGVRRIIRALPNAAEIGKSNPLLDWHGADIVVITI
jgi:hypothetical protein